MTTEKIYRCPKCNKNMVSVGRHLYHCSDAAQCDSYYIENYLIGYWDGWKNRAAALAAEMETTNPPLKALENAPKNPGRRDILLKDNLGNVKGRIFGSNGGGLAGA